MEHMLECKEAKKFIGSETLMNENKEELMTIYLIFHVLITSSFLKICLIVLLITMLYMIFVIHLIITYYR